VRRGANAPRPPADLRTRRSPLAGDPPGNASGAHASTPPSPGERCCLQRIESFTPETQSAQRGQDATANGPLRAVGARLRATRQAMPAEQTRAPRLPQEKDAACKECKVTPQRRRVRRGANAPRPPADLRTRRSPLAGDPPGNASGAHASTPPSPGERCCLQRIESFTAEAQSAQRGQDATANGPLAP
jgi:hypothetical protein